MLLVCCLPLCAQSQPSATGSAGSAATEDVVLPESFPDPLEPFNRMVWGFNRGLMVGVVKPTSKVYRFVVVKPVRRAISNFGRNLTYPGRLINNLLQGKWTGARDESYRFACNTTVGLAGFFDVGTRWKIPKSDADFGQTFGLWGWNPQCFIMLPILGPSNERDLLGFAADTAANPLLYISPYEFDGSNPLTYLGPYTYFSYAALYNDLSDNVGDYVRFSRAEMDAYAQIQYAWGFARSTRVADLASRGAEDAPTLETLGFVMFTPKDPDFTDRSRTRSVRISATGRRLKFTFWLQPGQAPVVYIVPGLGSHRLAQPALALAELLHRNGHSTVIISSAFHSEFMEQASTAALPAYVPVDGHDVHAAITDVDRLLQSLYPDRLGGRSLMGYSMGALHSLFIAASEATNQPALMKFDRYVAINPPVQLFHGVSKLDELYRAPLEWPEVDRTDNIENTLLKVAVLSRGTLTPETALPFSAIESRFLIGLTFRHILRDVVFSSQRRASQGVLRHSISNLRRKPVYDEILRHSYQDYFEKFVTPAYEAWGINAPVGPALKQAGDLRTYEEGLRANPAIRVITNQNDFLLADEDLAWLRATFSPEQLTVFAHGGHLGNLFDAVVQQRILEALVTNGPPSPSPDGVTDKIP